VALQGLDAIGELSDELDQVLQLLVWRKFLTAGYHLDPTGIGFTHVVVMCVHVPETNRIGCVVRIDENPRDHTGTTPAPHFAASTAATTT